MPKETESGSSKTSDLIFVSWLKEKNPNPAVTKMKKTNFIMENIVFIDYSLSPRVKFSSVSLCVMLNASSESSGLSLIF